MLDSDPWHPRDALLILAHTAPHTRPNSLLDHIYTTTEEVNPGREAILGFNTPPLGLGCTVCLPMMSPYNSLLYLTYIAVTIPYFTCHISELKNKLKKTHLPGLQHVPKQRDSHRPLSHLNKRPLPEISPEQADWWIAPPDP